MTTITFPTLSADQNAPMSVEIGIKPNTMVAVSDLSGYVQTRELPGARWSLSFRFQNMQKDNAALLEAFILQLRGQANRARVPLWGRTTRRGTWAGSPKVNNEVGSPTISQTGHTLYLRDFTAGANVKKGDYFNIGSGGQLCMMVADATADGAGLLTATVEPGIRVAPAHNTPIVSASPVVPFMILQNPHVTWGVQPGGADINPNGLTDFAFDLIEVFE
jgi:hypothetical protein